MPSQDNRSDTPKSDVWFVFETMGTDTPTLVYEDGHPRRLVRRVKAAEADEAAAMTKLVKKVCRTRQPEIEPLNLPGKPPRLLIAQPIDPVQGEPLYGVQVLLTTGDGLNAQTDRRRVGSYYYLPDDNIPKSTRHSLAMETEILHAPEPELERDSHQIFKQFEERLEWVRLEQFVNSVKDGSCNNESIFSSHLLMTCFDGAERSVFMTFRAFNHEVYGWTIRGLVHDVSDVVPPDRATGFNAAVVRKAFAMATPPTDAGVGLYSIPTGVLTEWLPNHEPPAPLARWADEKPELDKNDRERLTEELDRLIDRTVEAISLEMRVRFRGDGWIRVRYGIEVVSPGDVSHGYIRVTPLDPAPGQLPPLDADSGILAW